MVDSIVFRIHDLLTHERLVAYLHKMDRGMSKTRKVLEEEEFDPVKASRMVNYFKDHAKGNSFPEWYKGFLSSGHYDIVYRINYAGDFIEFNFSLPKYEFGNNLLQLVDHFNDPHINEFRWKKWWECRTYAWKRFVEVFNRFIDVELGGSKQYSSDFSPVSDGMVDKSKVQLMRLDLCFNMVFNTEQDAMFYLEELKRIRRKNYDYEKAQTTFGTSLYLASKSFTWKIYHKASEFKKHKDGQKSDYSRIKARFGKEQADAIHQLARTVLRYEIELRPSYLTDRILTDLQNDPKTYETYRAVNFSRAYGTHGCISEDGVRYNLDGLTNKGETGKFLKMDSRQRLLLSVGDFLKKKEMKFYLRANKDYSIRNLSVDEIKSSYNHIEQFNFDVFSIMVDKFKEEFLKFQISNFNQIQALNESIRLRKRNEIANRVRVLSNDALGGRPEGVSMGMVRTLTTLLRDYSWDEIKERGFLSRSSFYRYRKLFAKFGLTGRSVDNMDFHVDFSYKNYYNLIFQHFAFISKRNQFVRAGRE